jgi:hypothetical protein
MYIYGYMYIIIRSGAISNKTDVNLNKRGSGSNERGSGSNDKKKSGSIMQTIATGNDLSI